MQNEYLFACTVSQILMSPANAAHPMLHDRDDRNRNMTHVHNTGAYMHAASTPCDNGMCYAGHVPV